MNFLKRISLTIIAIIGFVTSIKLSMIYMDVNFNPYALSSFCSINEFIDCDGVAKTTHSQFLGVPLAFWGLFLYFVFIFLTYVDKIKNFTIKGFRIFAYFDAFQNPPIYISALGFIAFSLSMVLMFISLFEIQKICVLCFFTYVLNLLLALIALPQGENPFSVVVKSIKDFIEALKIKKYAITFCIVVLIAGGILAYTTLSNILTPQVKLANEYKQSASIYKISGNVLGDANAKLVVHVYSDYQCPFCFVLNTMLHRAVSELKNLKVVHHNLPLDMECNPLLKQQMHAGACQLAKYAIAAGYQGKFWDMNNLLFDKEFDNEEQLLYDAKHIKGLNIEKLKEDVKNEKVAKEIEKEINDALELGINGTPALRINMDTKIGILPYDELKEKLIKAGAIERK